MRSIGAAWQRIGDNPWLLLSLTVLFWSGNVVAARLVVGEMSPMVTVALRWGFVSAILVITMRRTIAVDWPLIRARWPVVAWMGASAFSFYNALFFSAALLTTGVHLALVQGVAPVFVFIGARIAFGTPIGAMRALGLALTLLGIVVVATSGDLRSLGDLSLNKGDLLILLASMLYAYYTILLPNRPKVSANSFFAALSFAAFLASLPLLGYEALAGQLIWPGLKGWLILAYIVVFPSLLAQVFFIRAVELIGPGRAGLFYNLTPVVGAILAVVMLHEPVGLYQIVALVLVLGGIFIAERGPKRWR